MATRLLPDPVGVDRMTFRPRDDLDERFLLVRVQRQPASLRPPGEGVEDGVGFGRLRQQVNQRHSGSMMPCPESARGEAARGRAGV